MGDSATAVGNSIWKGIQQIGFNLVLLCKNQTNKIQVQMNRTNQLSREIVAHNFPVSSSEDVEEVFPEPPQLSKSLQSAQPSATPAAQGLELNLELSDESSELLQITYSAKRCGKAQPHKE